MRVSPTLIPEVPVLWGEGPEGRHGDTVIPEGLTADGGGRRD